MAETRQKELPRGVSALVKETARALVAARGPEVLSELAKMHFKTASEVAPGLSQPTEEPGNGS